MSWVAAAIAGSAVVGGVTSRNASKRAANAQQQASDAAIAEQRLSKDQALGFFEPYNQVAGLGLEQLPFLTDSQMQYDWLQNNPLFQLSLDNANDVTSRMSAAKGRLSAGDTLMQLSNNTLLSAMPLLDRQTNNINNLLNFGSGIANSQANAALGVGTNISNLMTQQGNAQASGIMGSANATNDMLNGLTGSLMYYNMMNPSQPPATNSAISNDAFVNNNMNVFGGP